MAPSTAQQRTMVAQFASVTGANERQAARFLKAANFKMDQAMDEYYNAAHDAKASAERDSKLTALFDEIRDSKNDEKDVMGLESTMEYYQNTLGISLENAELFVVQDLLQAPSIGEVTRQGYVDGWKKAGVEPSHEAHANHVKALIKQLSIDQTLFKSVYRHAFVTGKEKDQKSLGLDNAVVYWEMLFKDPGMPWKTANHNWFDLWQSFLKEKWTRSVNRDMWNMTLEFAFKSMEDPSLSFWNEDGAWPTVIDDFVEWCHGRGIGKAETMDVDN